MNEMEQEKKASLHADVMLRRALDLRAKNNVLIAEFMGGILSSVPNLINLPQTIGDANILVVKGSEMLPNGTYSVHRLNELQYHTSWDWLMPVVDKIEQVHEGVPKQLINLSLFSTRQEIYQAVVELSLIHI